MSQTVAPISHVAASESVATESAAEVGSTGRRPIVLGAAKQPVGTGQAAWIGQLVALVLIVVGVVGIREAALAVGWTSGSSWVESLARRADHGYGRSGWLVPIGIVAVVLGVWLVVVAVRPRPKKTLALASGTGVFLTRRGIQNLVHRCADDVDGVTAVQVDASRRRVVVRVTATDPGSVGPAVTAAVTQRLQALTNPPTVAVKTRREGGSS